MDSLMNSLAVHIEKCHTLYKSLCFVLNIVTCSRCVGMLYKLLLKQFLTCSCAFTWQQLHFDIESKNLFLKISIVEQQHNNFIKGVYKALLRILI